MTRRSVVGHLVLTAWLALVLQGCASASAPRVISQLPGALPTKAWHADGTVGVGAETLCDPERQTARFGGGSGDLPKGLVPVLVIVHHLARPDGPALIVRAADISLEVRDGEVLRPLEAEALDAALPVARRPRLALAEPDEPKLRYEAPVTKSMVSAIRNPSDILLLLYLPATLTIDAGWSVAKWGYQLGQSNDGARERRARNTKLDTLDDVRLERGDSASAVLYFRLGEDGACIPEQGGVRVEFRAEDGTLARTVRLPLGSSTGAGSTATHPPPAAAAPDTGR